MKYLILSKDIPVSLDMPNHEDRKCSVNIQIAETSSTQPAPNQTKPVCTCKSRKHHQKKRRNQNQTLPPLLLTASSPITPAASSNHRAFSKDPSPPPLDIKFTVLRRSASRASKAHLSRCTCTASGIRADEPEPEPYPDPESGWGKRNPQTSRL